MDTGAGETIDLWELSTSQRNERNGRGPEIFVIKGGTATGRRVSRYQANDFFVPSLET